MTTTHKTASLARLFAAIFYDLIILIFGLFMVVGFAVLPVHKYFTGLDSIGANEVFFPFFLVSTAFLYYALSWIFGGQTIGMKAWRLLLVSDNPNQTISVKQVVLRFITAILSAAAFFLGFFYSIIQPNKRTLHDLVSGTHIRYYPKK